MPCARVVQDTFPILISSSASNCMNLGVFRDRPQ